jgi:hypothetical protein
MKLSLATGLLQCFIFLSSALLFMLLLNGCQEAVAALKLQCPVGCVRSGLREGLNPRCIPNPQIKVKPPPPGGCNPEARAKEQNN